MNNRAISVGLAAALAVATGLWSLLAPSADLKIDHAQVDEMPVTVFRPLSAPPGKPTDSPVILIAHGFAGSQQLMQPAAMTLAHSGYTAVTFDFAGHGRNARPLAGGIKDRQERARVLGDEIDRMIRFSLTLPGAGPRLGLVGHSMASDLIVRSALHNDAVAGIVAFSMFGGAATAREPNNLLVIDGAWEPAVLKDDGLRIVAMASGAPPQERVTYGEMARGTARRVVFAAGAEHIGVIYSRDGLTEMRNWMNAVFERTENGPIDARGKWLALLFIGLVALAMPLSRLLPALSPVPLGAGLSWKRQAPLAIAPALLTPLILWKAPTDFLPILLGDYLAVHLAVYGALTLFGLWLSGKFGWRAAATNSAATLSAATLSAATLSVASWRGCILAALPVVAYYGLGLGLPIDTFVTSIAPSAQRWLLIPAMLCSAAIYFLADEWLTSGPAAATGGYVFSKLCFVVSLAIAVALNPKKLFFLVIIGVVICIFFTVFGLVSRWTYARTRDPRVAALANAFALAWAICATFPVVS